MRKHSAILLVLLLAAPVAVWAQSTTQSFSVDSGRLRASITVADPPKSAVIDSLRDGLQSEIEYDVRVYERSGGILGLLGDKLVGDYHRTYRASWDVFSGDFVLSSGAQATKRLRSTASFLADFFRLHGADTGISLKPHSQYYVLSSVRIQIVKLVPPLTMISPFLSNREIDTPWVKTEITPR